MPIRTGFVNQVSKHPRMPSRFDVWLLGLPLPIYTLNPWLASICERAAGANNKAVTIRTKDSRYGEEIVDVTAPGRQWLELIYK